MSADIGKGTPLICVDEANSPFDVACGRLSGLTKGALYTCEEVHPDTEDDCPDCKGNCLRVHIVGKDYCYCYTLFRPLNDGDTSLVETEITTKEKEPVLV